VLLEERQGREVPAQHKAQRAPVEVGPAAQEGPRLQREPVLQAPLLMFRSTGRILHQAQVVLLRNSGSLFGAVGIYNRIESKISHLRPLVCRRWGKLFVP